MAKLNALSRCRAKPKGGATIPSVPAPSPSAIITGSVFPAYDTESVVQSYSWNWIGAGQAVYLHRANATDPATSPTTALVFVFSSQGNLDKWQFYRRPNGTNVDSSRNFQTMSSVPPVGTRMTLSHNASGNITCTRGDDGTDIFSNTPLTKSFLDGLNVNTGYLGTVISASAAADMQGQAFGNAVPITINSLVLDSQLRAVLDINYTGVGRTGYNIQLQTVAGDPVGAKVPATLSAVTAGRLTLTSNTNFTTAQYGSDVRVAVFEVVNGTETGYSRSATTAMPSAVATFGANLMEPDSDVAFRKNANAYLNQSGTLPGGSNADSDGYPIVDNIQRPIGPSDVSGRTRIVTWEGAGAVAELGGAECTFTEKTVIDANTYSYKETFNRVVSGDSAAAQRIPRPYIIINPTSGNATNHPTNIKIYDQGEDRNKIWADAYVGFHMPANGLNGAIRVMDARNINGNYAVNMTWEMRTPMSSTKWGVDGLQIEKVIALCNITGRDLWLPYPPYATDDYLTQLAIAINTGANLSQGAIWSNGLAPGLKWYAERSNEVWNTAFGIFRENRLRYSQRTGIAQLGDGNGGVEQGLKEHAFQYDRQMAIIMAAMPNWQTRLVRVFASQIANIDGYNIVMGGDGGFGRYVDALALAPYIQVSGGVVNALPDKTPASLETVYTPAAVAVLVGMANKKKLAKENGHRFICYEGALDMAANNDPPTYLNSFQIMAFRQSPSYYRMLYAHFSYWKANYGDLYMQYGDISGNPYYVYQWGLISYEGEPNQYGLQALQDVQAGLPSRY